MTTATVNMAAYDGLLRIALSPEQQKALGMSSHYWFGSDAVHTLQCIEPVTVDDNQATFRITRKNGSRFMTANETRNEPGPDVSVRANFKHIDVGFTVTSDIVKAITVPVTMVADDKFCVTIPSELVAVRRDADLMGDPVADMRPHATPFKPKDLDDGPGGVAIEDASAKPTFEVRWHGKEKPVKKFSLPPELIAKLKVMYADDDQLRIMINGNVISPRTRDCDGDAHTSSKMRRAHDMSALTMNVGTYSYSLQFINAACWALTVHFVSPA